MPWRDGRPGLNTPRSSAAASCICRRVAWYAAARLRLPPRRDARGARRSGPSCDARCAAETFSITDELYLYEVFETDVVPLLRSNHAFVQGQFLLRRESRARGQDVLERRLGARPRQRSDRLGETLPQQPDRLSAMRRRSEGVRESALPYAARERRSRGCRAPKHATWARQRNERHGKRIDVAGRSLVPATAAPERCR